MQYRVCRGRPDRRLSIELIINEIYQGKGEKQTDNKAEAEVVKPRKEWLAFFLPGLDFGLTVFATGRSRMNRFPAKGAFR